MLLLLLLLLMLLLAILGYVSFLPMAVVAVVVVDIGNAVSVEFLFSSRSKHLRLALEAILPSFNLIESTFCDMFRTRSFSFNVCTLFVFSIIMSSYALEPIEFFAVIVVVAVVVDANKLACDVLASSRCLIL